MKVAVCDDEQVMRGELARLIREQDPMAEISEFSSGGSLTGREETFDILFLDIEMKDMSGMDAAKQIRKRQAADGAKSIIIFVTAYRDYMEDAFDVGAFHYLVKPVDRKKFAEVFRRAAVEMEAMAKQVKDHILIKTSGVQRKIFLGDIFYIESQNKKVVLHTVGGIYETYGKMDMMERELGDDFYRCHRCYLVNMEKISAYGIDGIQLVNGEQILLARKKYQDFIKSYLRYAKNGGIVNV